MKRRIATEALELLERAAELVRSLNDPGLNAYVLADLEGRDGPGGYPWTFARDHLRDYARELPCCEECASCIEEWRLRQSATRCCGDCYRCPKCEEE